jgi:hypothetical protein
MKFKERIVVALGVLILLLSAVIASCSPAASAEEQDQLAAERSSGVLDSSVAATSETRLVARYGRGYATGGAGAARNAGRVVETGSLHSELLATGELSEAETDGLLYMVEEEKLAGDVYAALYEIWGLRSFENIAASEQTHTDAIRTLLVAYDLNDPTAGNAAGEFDNEVLQALYDQLVTQGSQSLVDALEVGAAIEEIDILDLEDRLEQTDNPDIQLVYENLTKGSQNHLRAFTSSLERQTGESYEPQYLSTDAYESIVDSTADTGGKRNGNRR